MSVDPVGQLERLKQAKPKDRRRALALLDDVVTLRQRLAAARDEVGRELTGLRRNIDAVRAYGRTMKGKLK